MQHGFKLLNVKNIEAKIQCLGKNNILIWGHFFLTKLETIFILFIMKNDSNEIHDSIMEIKNIIK